MLLDLSFQPSDLGGFGISTPTNLAPQMWSAGQSREAKLNSNYRELLVSMNQIFSDSCSLIIGQGRLLPDLFYDLAIFWSVASSSLTTDKKLNLLLSWLISCSGFTKINNGGPVRSATWRLYGISFWSQKPLEINRSDQTFSRGFVMFM